MIAYSVQSFFAGSWDLIWHWGLGIGLIILNILAAIFSPVFKKDFIYCAIIVAVVLLVFAAGQRAEQRHVVAQQQVQTKFVKATVAKTKTPKAKAKKDRYDNAKY